MFKEFQTTAAPHLSEAFLDTLPLVFCRAYRVEESIRFLYVSQAVYAWTGCRPEAFTAEDRNWLVFVHPDDRSELMEILDRAEADDEEFVIEYRLQGDTDRWVRHIARRGPSGKHSQVVWDGCIEDITTMRQAGQDLERSQLLQNMGRLSAGIAHEINTPIQFVGDNLHFLAEAWEAVSMQFRLFRQAVRDAGIEHCVPHSPTGEMEFIFTEAPDAIRQSLEGIERIGGLIAAMRDFSHLDERRMAPADINRAIQSTLTLLRNELKYAAEVRTELDSSLPDVHCSVDELCRALMNLLINAGHSIKEKIDRGVFTRGIICVRSRRVGEMLELSVSDNGMGIPADIQPRIYERFFTTKRHTAAQGTGQGLAMVRSIVEDLHRGQITFDTAPAEGTTFTLRIPLQGQTERARS